MISRPVSYMRGQKSLSPWGAALQDTVKHARHEQAERCRTLADLGAQERPLKTIEIEVGDLLRIEVRPQFAHRLGLAKQAGIPPPPAGQHRFQLGAEAVALIRQLLTEIANQAPAPTPTACKPGERLFQMAAQAGGGALGGLPPNPPAALPISP